MGKWKKAIEALDAVDGRDPEVAHYLAEEILLKAAPLEVQEAYKRIVQRAGAWWYA